MGKDDDATVAFEQRVIRSDPISHHVVCDMCSLGKYIVGVRWFCVECPDMDFCDLHYNEYTNQTLKVGGCYKHKLLKIPRNVFASLEPGIINEEGLTLGAWLSSLQDLKAADPDAST